MSDAISLLVRDRRPAFMPSRPVWIDRVFDDPDAVIDTIQRSGPYPTLAEFERFPDARRGAWLLSWFRARLADGMFKNNLNWIEAAKHAFSASIVEPIMCFLNINTPGPTAPMHMDPPLFRGFEAPNGGDRDKTLSGSTEGNAAPLWLLSTMSRSGLFHRWMVPMATGLAWFYRGEGGEFEYWPDGLTAPSRKVRAPTWNCGLVSDNEAMWHRVLPVGRDQGRSEHLRTGDRLHYVGDGHWELRDDARPLTHLVADRLRISLLWKAFVFKDEAHRLSFKDPNLNLTMDEMVEIYRHDLAQRGISVKRPDDPFNDTAWRETLQAHYPPPSVPPSA